MTDINEFTNYIAIPNSIAQNISRTLRISHNIVTVKHIISFSFYLLIPINRYTCKASSHCTECRSDVVFKADIENLYNICSL